MALSLEIVDKSIVWLWHCHWQTSGMALSLEIVDKSMVWLWNLTKKVVKIMVWLLPLHCQYSYTAVLKTNTVDKVTLWPCHKKESWQSSSMAVTVHWQNSCKASGFM